VESGTQAFTRKTRNILLHINQQFTLILNFSQQRREREVPAPGFVLSLPLKVEGKREPLADRSPGTGCEISRS